MIGGLLTQIAPLAQDSAQPAYSYEMFLKPLPFWADSQWPWLILPLIIAVAIVYKSIKCAKVSQIPKEATVLALWILAGMGIAAGILALIVEALERTNS